MASSCAQSGPGSQQLASSASRPDPGPVTAGDSGRATPTSGGRGLRRSGVAFLEGCYCENKKGVTWILLTCLMEVCLSGVVEVVVSSGTEAGGTTGVLLCTGADTAGAGLAEAGIAGARFTGVLIMMSVNPDCAAAVDSEVARDRGEADS